MNWVLHCNTRKSFRNYFNYNYLNCQLHFQILPTCIVLQRKVYLHIIYAFMIDYFTSIVLHSCIILCIDLGGHVIFNISDYWYKYIDFGVRLDAMLQDRLESGILQTNVKERSAYIYPVVDATIYVLKKTYCDLQKHISN